MECVKNLSTQIVRRIFALVKVVTMEFIANITRKNALTTVHQNQFANQNIVEL
jgi:hypothetical protein